MSWKKCLCAAAVVATLFACGTNKEATKKRLLESGNSYFEHGKYREAAIIYRRAIAEDRRFGEAYYRLALAELRMGRIVQALRALRRATELEPENADAFGKLSEIYVLAFLSSTGTARDKLIAELKDLVARAEKQRTDSYEVFRVKGYIALTEKDAPVAIENFRKALQVRPADGKITVALVEALELAGRLDEAEQVALEGIQHDSSYGPIYDSLYSLYLKQDRSEAAAGVIQRKCENNPDNIEFKIQLAAHYHRMRQPEERDRVLEELESEPARFPTAPLMIGDFLVRIRDYERAIREYQAGLKLHPADSVVYQLRIVDALSLAGRNQEALQLVGQVLAEHPKNAEALALRGALQLVGGDREAIQAAINDFETAVVNMPRNAVLRYNYGRAYLALGDLDKALVQFQDAASLRADYLAPRFALAQIYLRKGQPAMAAKLAEEILTIAPGSVPGRLLRASASIGLKEFHQARANVDSVLKEHPDNPDAQFLIASLDFAERKYRDAEALLKKLHENIPQDPRGLRGLVNVYVAQGRAKEAQRILDEELSKNPESRELHLVAASVATAAKDYGRAITEYSRILERDPSSASVHVALGTAYYRARDFAQAEFHYRKARELQPKDLTANLRLALLLGETGKLEEAKRLLDQILKLAPDNPVALNNMAYLLADSAASLDAALTLAQRAIARAPGNPTIMDTLGWIYLKKNLSDNAVQIYEELVNRFPQGATWRYHLAMALYQKGDRPRARRQLQQALTSNPSQEEEKKIRELLAKLGS